MFRNGARRPQGPLEEPKGRDLTRLLNRYLVFLVGDGTSLLEMMAYRIVLYEETEEGRSEVHKAERDIATFHEKWPALDLNADDVIDIETSFREDFEKTHKSDDASLHAPRRAPELHDDVVGDHAQREAALEREPLPEAPRGEDAARRRDVDVELRRLERAEEEARNDGRDATVES